MIVLHVLLFSGLNTTVKGCIDEKKSLSETLVAGELLLRLPERSAVLGPSLTGSGALGIICVYRYKHTVLGINCTHSMQVSFRISTNKPSYC